jgi:chromosomal replication initiator protein
LNAKLEHVSALLHATLRAAVDETTYRLWLEPIRVEEYSGRAVTLSAPSQIHAWVEERFAALLRNCARDALGPAAHVDLITRTGSAHEPRRAQRDPHVSTATAGTHTASSISHMRPNPQLTFEHFVIGECNRLAHGAALTIAEAPGQGFNPLFICGPPGVGKTHLLHSISTFLLTHDPTTVVCLTSSESFTTEFLAALQANRIGPFKARFRRVDVLLIDDIQFLERKTRTEEEFFHTFNALYEVGSQIVMTSDRPPRDLRQLETRLRERFEAGLMADIHPPDLTTRTTIIHKLISDQGIHVEDTGVIDLLSDRVTTSVRALEGALIRTVAFASLTGRPITAELAEEVLRTLYAPAERAPGTSAGSTITEIQDLTSKHFGLSRADLLSASRARHLTWPRQLAMHLARELTHESLPAIGRLFGGRDHTTVLYACRRAQARLDHDATAQQAAHLIRSHLQAPSSATTPST